jgi:transcriptional regulator with XRE-family HTH domain
MMCPTCKTTEMGRSRGRYQYRESGLDNVWLVGLEMYVCPECKLRLPIFRDLELITRYITRELVRERGRLNGASVLFLRKAMRLRASELAEIIGVDRVTVSRWENDKVVIDPYRDFKLRMEAIDRILTPHERRSARENVSLVLHRTYKPEISISDLSVDLTPAAAKGAPSDCKTEEAATV